MERFINYICNELCFYTSFRWECETSNKGAIFTCFDRDGSVLEKDIFIKHSDNYKADLTYFMNDILMRF